MTLDMARYLKSEKNESQSNGAVAVARQFAMRLIPMLHIYVLFADRMSYWEFTGGPDGSRSRARGENKTEEIKEKKPNSFESLINDTRFSDVQVLVGPTEVEYNLHRNFLAHRSEYFGRALDPSDKWKESKDGKIRLPEIHPPAFKAIITWVYGGAFGVLDHKEYLPEIYKAADYLQISDFKDSFFEQVMTALKKDSPAKKPARDCSIPEPFIMLGQLLAIAPERDYPTIQKIANTLTQYFNVPWSELRHLMTEDYETINAKALFYMIGVGLEGAQKNPPDPYHRYGQESETRGHFGMGGWGNPRD
ncbi:hypothetical protein TWF281_004899 [Arthrobotrys megalospora]